jgi:outer membrane receptor protein involved in Fe transport
VLNDHLRIETGFRGKFFSKTYQRFFWYLNGEPRYPLSLNQQKFTGALDFLFFAKLGDAVVHFTIENLLNTKYYVVPFYPMPDRNLRLGVTWEFLN